jgi:hypothetical protein
MAPGQLQRSGAGFSFVHAGYALTVSSGSSLRSFARLLPVPFATYELRDLLGSAGHAASAAPGLVSRSDAGSLLVIALLTLLAAALLRETARGLPARTPRPQWSRGFVGLWMLCAAALAVGLSCEHLLRGSGVAGAHVDVIRIASGASWSSALSALLIGFLAALSLRSVRWVMRAVTGRLGPRLAARVGPPVSALHSASSSLSGLAPVVDGWSSRGPPLFAAVAARVS